MLLEGISAKADGDQREAGRSSASACFEKRLSAERLSPSFEGGMQTSAQSPSNHPSIAPHAAASPTAKLQPNASADLSPPPRSPDGCTKGTVATPALRWAPSIVTARPQAPSHKRRWHPHSRSTAVQDRAPTRHFCFFRSHFLKPTHCSPVPSAGLSRR